MLLSVVLFSKVWRPFLGDIHEVHTVDTEPGSNLERYLVLVDLERDKSSCRQVSVGLGRQLTDKCLVLLAASYGNNSPTAIYCIAAPIRGIRLELNFCIMSLMTAGLEDLSATNLSVAARVHPFASFNL